MTTYADGDIDDMTAITNVMHVHGDWAYRMRLRREKERRGAMIDFGAMGKGCSKPEVPGRAKYNWSIDTGGYTYAILRWWMWQACRQEGEKEYWLYLARQMLDLAGARKDKIAELKGLIEDAGLGSEHELVKAPPRFIPWNWKEGAK